MSDDDDEKVRALVKKALGGKKPRAVDDEGGNPEAVEESHSEEREMTPVVDEVDLKDALRGAFQAPPGAVAPNLLRGVQKKLRVRSRGKFYGDGWSTAESPKTTYLVTSAIMLLLVLIVFFALVPWSSSSLP